jgi:hypothetical protein
MGYLLAPAAQGAEAMTAADDYPPWEVPPPRMYNRAGQIRAMSAGTTIVVEGNQPVVSATAHKVLGRGNYRVEQLEGQQCRVWRLKGN